MIIYNGLFIVIVALLIVAGVCLGLLIALVVFTLGRRSSSQSPTSDAPTPLNQSKRIADTTMKMTVGLMAIVFSATLVPVEKNWVFASILLVGGLVVVILSYIQFQRI
jgi:dipeptide/tripeptide permease